MDNQSQAVPKVYAAISAVTDEIAKTGISKGRRNEQQGYAFRGIDDVYNALAPILAKHKLVILPRMLSREQTERQTQKGTAIFTTSVDAEFDFVSAEDGSMHTTKAFGEAMDTADKSTNKAMSAAYKYTAIQTFCIPTEGDNDADAQTHEPVARDEHDQRRPETSAPRPHPDVRKPVREEPPTPPERRAVASGHGTDLLISELQAKRLFGIARDAGWHVDDYRGWLKEVWGVDDDRKLTRKVYEAVVAEARKGPILAAEDAQ